MYPGTKPQQSGSGGTTRDAQGSITQIDYPGGYYREQAPVHLKYICALNGVPSPSLERPFSYCELGCGVGETTAMLAAVYPQGQFYGLDLSPSHITHAQTLADASDLTNITFIAADIATLDTRTLPNFDFITLHGLYSWVTQKVQQAIRCFVAGKLKPGGIAYLSYNALPGWGAATALRRFFLERAHTLDGDALTQAAQIRGMLEDIRTKEAPYFQQNPAAAGIMQRIRDADLRYVAHEYLAQSWQPRYFVDVYDEFAAHGLTYVGSGEIVDNLLEHSIAPQFVELLKREPGVRDREHLRDFIQNRFFRRDLYRKPDPDATPASAEALLQDTLFGLVAAPIQVPGKVNIPDAPSIEFAGPRFKRIKQLLAYRVLTLREILADQVLQTVPDGDLIDAIKLLTIGGSCAAFATRETIPSKGAVEVIKVVPKINAVRLARQDWSEPSFTLTSPVTGSGISLNTLETALLSGVQRHHPVPWIWSEFKRRDIELRTIDTKSLINDDQAGQQAVQDAHDQFIKHKLPKLAYLGVVVPG